ncbi:MAG TPA: TPM domain-containing protein [Lysobacter sp.]|jgi:uncharacterized membrane protein|nr:TPM domain-containing protein [Lysobacter sp.]
MRWLKHLFAPSARRMFPADSLQRITAAIAASEARHTGEIRFAVESALHPRAVLAGMQARDRARDAFAQLRVWDTRANNGVLLYLLLADHRIEIVADRGFEGLVSAEQWRGACLLIEERLKAGEPEVAVLRGVEALSALIEQHFPRDADYVDVNELPDEPHLL